MLVLLGRYLAEEVYVQKWTERGWDRQILADNGHMEILDIEWSYNVSWQKMDIQWALPSV